MIDLVYPLKESGGPDSNVELRYSLRSIERNLRMEIGRIFVLGFKPAWMAPEVILIPMRDRGDKAMNLRAKYEFMVNSQDISDPFVLLDDDHIFMHETDSLPLHTRGALEPLADEYNGRTHGVYLRNCLNALRAHDLPTLNYQLHYSMHISKPVLARAVEMMKLPMVMGSLYGNLVGGPTVEVAADVKVNTGADFRRLRDAPFMSLSDRGLRVIGVRSFFAATFPEVSRWEQPPTRMGVRRLRIQAARARRDEAIARRT